MMPGSGADTLRTTGGQIDSIVLALIEVVYDKSDHVTTSMCKSLFSIGKRQPNLVLSSCHSYLKCHPKLPLAHKILILSVLEEICNDALKSVKKSVALELIALATEEMTSSKDIVPEWQNAASGILVSLGRNFHHDVMEQLLSNFPPGVLPHFFILQTMANLASANVFGMVPFLKAVLGTLLPLLCTVKQGNMRWIFSYALARFSEAIAEYLANIEKAPDPTVTKDAFTSEIGSAYDILFNNWLQSREAKVRSEVILALGHMSHILNAEKLEELLPKVIPVVLSMYKRYQDHQYATEGLCMILDAAISNKSSILEMYLDNILSVLFPQICTLPDYTLPSSVRNHNEVLRCFAVLASAYSDRLLVYLLLRLENNSESHRVGALTVIKHLINSSDVVLKDKVYQIICGLQGILDSGNTVKKVITQVIVALAHHGYLANEGGTELIRFIVTQCALPNEQTGSKKLTDQNVTNEALRGMCENVMHLLTTTVEKMQIILWPYLFDLLLSEHLTPAVGIVCKSLAFLAEKEKEEYATDFTIEFSSLAHVLTPQALFARLIVLCGYPHEGNRGLPILQLLKSIAPAIGRNLKALWDTEIPRLTNVLDDFSDWDQQMWENYITQFFIQTLAEYDREEWAIKLGKAFLSQFPLYATISTDKYMLLKFLGLVMKKVSNKTFVSQALDAIFDNVNHHDALERLGCAVATGFCAAIHLDMVLVKLEQAAKEDRKSSGLFSFIKEFKGDLDHERLKATIILCYGHVTMNGSASILSTRIETPILRSISNFYLSSKDLLVKESMLETIKMVAEAVHPEKMNGKFVFRSRNELLGLMKNVLKTECSSPFTSSILPLALSASASLVATDPILKDDEKCSLIEVAVSSVYSLRKEIYAKKSSDSSSHSAIEFDKILFTTMDSLNFLLENLLLKERTHENLQTMIQILSVWINSKHDVEKERCLNSVLHLLHSYFKAIKSNVYSPFSTFGSILAILVPRCTDPQVIVRHLAFDSIDALLSILLQLQAHEKCLREADELSLNYLKQQITSDDAAALFSVTKDLGKMISEKLPTEQVFPFLKCLINGLSDVHSQSSTGASVVLNSIIKRRGRELRQDATTILMLMKEKLSEIHCPHSRKGTLKAIQTMASLHSIAVLSLLLSSHLPLDVNTIDIWQILVQDESLAKLVTSHCLEILSDSVLVTPPDPHGRSNSQVTLLKPLVAVFALREIFKVSEMQKCCIEHFDHIFSVLLLVIGQYVGAIFWGNVDYSRSMPVVISRKPDSKAAGISPIRCAVETLKNFLICANENNVVTSMAEMGFWISLEDSEKYTEAVAALGRFVCSSCPSYVPKIIAFLSPMLNSSVEVQRIVTVAVFAECLCQASKEHTALIEPLINNLLGRLVDSSPIVRKLCIYGLGSIGKLDKEQVQRYSTTVLSAMMAGLDDKDDPGCDVTLEAMNGLSSVLSQVEEENVRGMLINIALRVKPMFEKEKSVVRAAAFTLFGNLSEFGKGPSKEPFVEQIHNNLIALLLHLNDEDKQVVKSCKNTLKSIGPLLESENVNSMFQKHLFDDGHLHYGEFLNGVAKCLINAFSEKIGFYSTTCLSYLKTPYPFIQCNATIFLGHMLGNLPADQHFLVSKERICSALVSLLKDQSSDVRIRAAESLSLLYEY